MASYLPTSRRRRTLGSAHVTTDSPYAKDEEHMSRPDTVFVAQSLECARLVGRKVVDYILPAVRQ
jgi:hypothetical protein